VLEVREIHGGYSGKEVLKGLSMKAYPGQITAVLGPNGCGKSTLLKTICGMLSVQTGSIYLKDEDLLRLPSNRLAQKVSYLSQNRQVPDITVGRLVLHGRFPYLNYPRRYRPEDYRIADQVMEKMQIKELADVPLNQLSGGQQQKAYIAMALAQDTDVILLDEPTTYLDVTYQLQMLGLARELAQEGKYVIMVMHDLSLALGAADRVVLMQEGNVVMQDIPEKIYETGILDRVFKVKVARVQMEGKWHYFCK